MVAAGFYAFFQKTRKMSLNHHMASSVILAVSTNLRKSVSEAERVKSGSPDDRCQALRTLPPERQYRSPLWIHPEIG